MNNSDSLFAEVFNDLFSESEWDDWAKCKVNLFDLYMEKTGVSKEEAQKIRERQEPVKKNVYKDFVDNPVIIPEKNKSKKCQIGRTTQ
tara:strand:+ start:809 stop:1072 length:264 start_codon:yes stop_codon:yes gene_type:complete